MYTRNLKYILCLGCLMILHNSSKAQFSYPVRKDISFHGQLVDMQKRFTSFINDTRNPHFILARQLSVEGMLWNDKMENRKSIICYIKAELELMKSAGKSSIKQLLLADIKQNKGRAYHYIGSNDTYRLAFLNESRNINLSLLQNKDMEVARFAYFFLATNCDMMNNGYNGIPGKWYGCNAMKIKRDILQIRGAEMGRSYWNYSVHFWKEPPTKILDTKKDSFLYYSNCAESEFTLDKEMDRVYYGEFTATNKKQLAERYLTYFMLSGKNSFLDSIVVYCQKTIASLSIQNSYQFPNALPAFLDKEEMMREGRSLSDVLLQLYDLTNKKIYLEIARGFLDSAIHQLANCSGEVFYQGNRNIAEMNSTYYRLIAAACKGNQFPIKDEKALPILLALEKAKTYLYRKREIEDEIMKQNQRMESIITFLRNDTAQYNLLEARRSSMNTKEYLAQSLQILTRVDSLENLNYKQTILNSISLETDTKELSNISNLIDLNTIVLIYYFGEGYVDLCVTLTRGKIEINKIDTINLRSKIARLHSTNIHQQRIDNNWCQLSNDVYKQLVLPFLPEQKNKNLVIINGGLTSSISFESLVTSFKQSGSKEMSPSYLVQDYTIRYEYYLKPFYSKWNKQNDFANNTVYAFAPEYKGITEQLAMRSSNLRSQCTPLYFNIPEAQSVLKNQNGKVFLKDSATETNFRKVCQHANILHFALHSFTAGDNIMNWGLVFAKDNSFEKNNMRNKANADELNDGVLNVHEIYNMRINANLAVLSACETGIGYFENGIGTKSLGLAFRSAGCPNSIVSLWKVDDRYTSEFMENFYAYLSSGTAKSEALSLAKRDFIKSHPSAGPFYWSAFVLYGDNEAVIKKTNLIDCIDKITIAVLILFLMVLAINYYSHKKNRSSFHSIGL